MAKQKSRFVLFLIILIGAFLRIFLLSSNPPSPTWDEASWGYNAYSLSIDGGDEFGRFLPLTYLESFGDYKPPVYAYITIPFVKILGLTELSVRLPSAILGTVTILLTYLLTKKIFFSINEQKKEIIALLSALVLAISPWHVLLSRAAFEANVATFFIVAGIYLFLASFGKKWLMPLSVLFFALSMYTFNSARVFVPLFGLFLFVKYFKALFKEKKVLFISALVGLFVFLPLFLFLLTPEARLRYKEVNIFSDSNIVITSNQEIANDGNTFWSKIIHNRRVGYSLAYAKHYLDNFDPQFLFIRGDGNPKFSIQDVGQMYIWEIPFFVLGVLFLFRKREGHYLIMPFWILLSVIPAGVARETPHALRIETVLPTFQILTAYGVYYLFEKIVNSKFEIAKMPIRQVQNRHLKYLIFPAFILIVTFNFLYFVHNYFTHYPKLYSNEWQYGYKEAISFIADNQSKYDKIHITEALGRPYIYFLFHTKYPPEKFRENSTVFKDAAGFTHVSRIGKYLFKNDLDEGVDMSEKNLFIAEQNKLPSRIKVLRRFKQLDGTVVLVAYERKIVRDEKLK